MKGNAEMQVLRLEGCNSILSDDVELLEEIVVDVIWDGVEVVEQGDEDYYDDGYVSSSISY